MWVAMLLQLSSVLGALTQCYSEELGLDPVWEIEVKFDSLPNGWIAATSAMPAYYRATIYYDTTAMQEALDEFEGGTDAAIRRVVLHELWHVMMWEFTELAELTNAYASRLEEQFVTRIERLPFWQDLCKGAA